MVPTYTAREPRETRFEVLGLFCFEVLELFCLEVLELFCLEEFESGGRRSGSLVRPSEKSNTHPYTT